MPMMTHFDTWFGQIINVNGFGSCTSTMDWKDLLPLTHFSLVFRFQFVGWYMTLWRQSTHTNRGWLGERKITYLCYNNIVIITNQNVYKQYCIACHGIRKHLSAILVQCSIIWLRLRSTLFATVHFSFCSFRFACINKHFSIYFATNWPVLKKIKMIGSYLSKL